jgi:hypothetical protein
VAGLDVLQKMKFYLKLCQQLDLPPKLFIPSLAVGFAGSLICMFLLAGEQHRDQAIFFLPLVAVPYLLVQFSAQGSFWQRQGKSFVGCFVTFFVAMVPGSLLGGVLARHYY